MPAPANRKEIGRVISADWNTKTNAIDFVIEFNDSGWTVSGSCPSGFDARSNTFSSSQALRQRVDQVKRMVVYDQTGRMNVAKMTREQLMRLTLNMSLSGAGISVAPKPADPDANAFISRILG